MLNLMERREGKQTATGKSEKGESEGRIRWERMGGEVGE